MDTSREDVGIAIRSAFLSKGIKQRFSLFVLIILSIIFIFDEKIETKPLNYFRFFVKDVIYRGALIISAPFKSVDNLTNYINSHTHLYSNYSQLKEENYKLKEGILRSSYLELENTQLRKLIEEQVSSSFNLASARVMLDKQSPYLNSFVINIGSNRDIINGLAVLDGMNFIGRIVDVNFFSSRVLLVSDLNSKIPVIVEPTGHHAILGGHGNNEPTLQYLPENHNIQDGDKVYTSGKEGIFSPGIPIGEIKIDQEKVKVYLFSDLSQITFVNIILKDSKKSN